MTHVKYPGGIGLAISLTLAVSPYAGSALTRDDAVAAVLENHPDVVAGRQDWLAARGRHLQRISPQNPELEVEYEELDGALDTGEFGERVISLSQTIPNPIRWALDRKASLRTTERVRFGAYEWTQLQVAWRAKVAFDRVLADQLIHAASQKDQALSESIADRARIRHEAGDISKLEMLRIEVQAAQARNATSEAAGRLAVSRRHLHNLLGVPSDSGLKLKGSLSSKLDADSGAPSSDPVSLRPDVRRARMESEAAQASKSARMAGIIPDLELSIGRQTISSNGARESFWRTSIGFDIPLWAAFRQRGEIGEASAEVARAEAELASVERSARLEVDEARLIYEASRERVRLFEERILGLAEEAFRVAQESYRQGKATYLNLLGAQRAFAESRIQHTEILFEHRRAIADLERTLGTDLPQEVTP